MSTEPTTSGRARRVPDPAEPLLVGLVGRAGSGKSTVAAALRDAGALVLDADRIGHEVTDHDPEVRAALAIEYGADVYLPDGRLDRARVAARVFSDEAALARLNTLVHPRILAELRRAITAHRVAGGAAAIVVDAALMLDWGFERECDAVLAVVAPESLQVERLVRGRGWTEAQARKRLAAQRSNEVFQAAADETIVNEGSLDDVRREAARALERMAERRRRAAATRR